VVVNAGELISRVGREIAVRQRLLAEGSTSSGLIELADLVIEYLDAEAVFEQTYRDFKHRFIDDFEVIKATFIAWDDASKRLQKATTDLKTALGYDAHAEVPQ
jgi:hypothetical protein